MIPVEDKKALERNAEANGRSIGAELRMAIASWLKSQGRRA